MTAHPVGKVELVNQRLAKGPLLRLSTENHYLIAKVIVGHTEIVASFAGGNEACLGNWNPNVSLNIVQCHILQAIESGRKS